MNRQRITPEPPTPDEPSKFVKYTIFFINVLFWLLSVMIIGIGIYVMVENRDLYGELTDLYYDPVVIFLAFGGLLFIITFTGCIGALRENTCLLAFYTGVVTLILMLEVVCGIVGFVNRDSLEEKVDTKLRDAIRSYRDPDKPDLHFLIDTAQQDLGCCGSDSYIDWRTNIYFNCSALSVSACGVPFSCCKTEDQQINRQCGFGLDKLDSASRQERIHVEGCLDVATAWFQDNLALIGGLSFGVVVLQILTIFLAATLRNQILFVKKAYT